MTSLREEFVANATAVGFVIHDGSEGAQPEAGAEPSHAAFGIAATGSVVLLSSEEPRARSLLPEVHWTYLPEGRIVKDLSTLFAALPERLPGSVAIISGPSQSGDIDMTLQRGVHGPGEVHIVLTA